MRGIANFNNLREKPLVFLSPLNWGLGHTTRCIPLIRELLHLGCDVIVACTETQKALLAKEFQSVRFVIIADEPPAYGNSRLTTLAKLLLQAPKLLRRVKREHRWLQAFLSQEPVDAIISDNRFGLAAPNIPSIFITHQLQIKTGLGRAIDLLARQMNYRLMRKFSACWVPDYRGAHALAGKLSNPDRQPPIPVHYIGPLSRFTNCTAAERPGEILIVLSGPEPQRTLLEQQVLNGLSGFTGGVHLVRGLPGNAPVLEPVPGIKITNHASADTMNQLVCSAEWIISRAGYTTVMDMLKLGKKTILIPTPGQAEQEYLADYLHNQQLVFTVPQHRFSLPLALQQAARFPYRTLQWDMEGYKKELQQFVRSLMEKRHTAAGNA